MIKSSISTLTTYWLNSWTRYEIWLAHFCNVGSNKKIYVFWFEVTVNKIWSNFQTFVSFALWWKKTLKLNLLKKKTFTTFLLYFISFSVVYSFESRARRTILVNVSQNVSWFPCILMFTAHFVAYLWSLPELLRRGRTTHDHQGRQSKKFLFFLWSFLFPEGGDWVGGGGGVGGVGRKREPNPRSKIGKFFSNSKTCYF